jgi:hypothetical protein
MKLSRAKKTSDWRIFGMLSGFSYSFIVLKRKTDILDKLIIDIIDAN